MVNRDTQTVLFPGLLDRPVLRGSLEKARDIGRRFEIADGVKKWGVRAETNAHREILTKERKPVAEIVQKQSEPPRRQGRQEKQAMTGGVRISAALSAPVRGSRQKRCSMS